MLYVSRIFYSLKNKKSATYFAATALTAALRAIQEKSRHKLAALGGQARTLYDFFLELHYAMRFMQVTVAGGKGTSCHSPHQLFSYEGQESILIGLGVSHLILQLSL